VTNVSALNQTSLWVIFIILTLFALASALLSVAALTQLKSTKSVIIPLAVFLISLGGIILVNLVTSPN